MNICFFVCSTKLGGLEKVLIELSNKISKKHKTLVIVPRGTEYKKLFASNVILYEYHSKDSRYNLFLYLELLKRINKFKADIVHTHAVKASNIFFKINYLLKNIVHIGTKHNPRKGKIFSKIKYVTAVSDDVSKSIKNNKSKIIYNGVTPIEIKEVKNNKIFTINAIGRLDKIKGFDKLISEVAKTKSNFVLNIVGDGEEYQSLNDLIIKLKLEEKVKLVGFKTDIPQLLANSDLVIMTSLSEGFSLVMVESLFYSKLFVSTRVSGCKDILSDKLLINDFDIAEKIDDIINNYELYTNEYSNIKKKYKEKFLLSNIVNEYLEYYEEVIESERKC